MTHDGRLTAEQAEASWPSVARHFAEIDKDNRGYVTIDQIRAFRREHRRHRGAAGTPSTAAQPAEGTGTPTGTGPPSAPSAGQQ